MDGPWQFHPILVLLSVSVAFSGVVAAYSFRSRETPGATALGGLMFATAWWSASYLVQLLGTGAAWQMFWAGVGYVGVAVLPVAWFAFALQYTGTRIEVTRGVVAALALPSVLLSAAVMANGIHGLAWTVTGVAEAPLTVVERRFHALYYFHVAYAYSLVLGGMFLLFRRVARSRRILRRQALAVLVGIAVSLAANVYWLVGGAAFNYTPTAFTASGAVFAFALFRYRLLDLVPVARDTVVEEMRDAYLVLDRDRRVVDLNPAAERLPSLSGDAIGCPLSAVAPALDDLVEAESDARRWDSTLVLDADDGGHRFLEVRASPLTETGDGTVLTVRDATERQRAQRRFQSVIEGATDVVVVLGAAGRVEYVSPPVERLVGHAPESLVGRLCFDLVDETDRAEIARTFERLRASPNEAERFEARVTAPGGERVILEGIGRNLLGEPFVEGVVVNLRDITERTRRERKIERANDRLERFASVVSHDLRNPLNVALGHLELARETGDDEHARTVARALSRMDDIVQDALSLARNGRVVEDPAPIRLGEVASPAWDVVATAGARFTVESDGAVVADPDRLRRLFENLFRNAVEHGSTGNQTRSGDAVEYGSTDNRTTPDDPVEHGDGLDVWVGATEDGFYVEDSGPGVPAERADDVFEPGVTANEGGTGLGLAIVAEIVGAHGWEISVESGRTGGARLVVAGASVTPCETTGPTDAAG